MKRREKEGGMQRDAEGCRREECKRGDREGGGCASFLFCRLLKKRQERRGERGRHEAGGQPIGSRHFGGSAGKKLGRLLVTCWQQLLFFLFFWGFRPRMGSSCDAGRGLTYLIAFSALIAGTVATSPFRPGQH